MPELPEVETVRRGLAPHLEGARIVRAVANRPDLRFPLPPRFAHRLTGARVEALERRAKYLLARLDTGETLICHLGMTGRFSVAGRTPGVFEHAAGGDPKHDHVVIETDRGETVTFNDARRFGYMDLAPTADLARSRWLADVGPEPLGRDFDAAHLARAFQGKRQNVKVSLLDQRIVAGLGNIYVSEALHRARILPSTPAGDLSFARLKGLAKAVRAVLEDAIAAGGSTLRDYRAADGALGYFQHRFRVYGREDEPCLRPRCRGQVARSVQAGRSTFHCPACQT
jgi:formamidopyrimidine-DNA glycosylase